MRVSASLVLILRICAGLLFGLLGWYIADLISPSLLPAPLNNAISVHVLMGVVIAIVAMVVLPAVLLPTLNRFIDQVSHATGAQIIADFVGFFLGLLIAALLAVPLALLPDPFRQVLPLLSAIVFAYIGVLIMNTHYREIFSMLNVRIPIASSRSDEAANAPLKPTQCEPLLLDTSVIIDGRVADISTTGFLRGDLVVPRFVLNELQHVADSADSMRRARGRRGLEVLKRLQKESLSPVKIVDDDPSDSREVDGKLVVLAKQWQCPIVTNDYNLNKVASLQGVRVLNVNELANAVKSMLLPGETLTLRVIQEGKETGQGVGYLDDGTMVVIEDGRSYLNQVISVTVTKVLQTAAGRMIFAKA
jgi:uncharacterized protein YacL